MSSTLCTADARAKAHRGLTPHMHTYLRAWREHRKISQVEVGARLGVSHTTIGRWETGKVPITTLDLERLAEVYGITRSQIEHSPELSDMVTFLDRAKEIIKDMPAEDLDRWLAIGESLRRPK